jgi:hypothetical protein
MFATAARRDTLRIPRAPVAVPANSWLEFRVRASDKQTDATSSGALVQLGGVTANFTPSPFGPDSANAASDTRPLSDSQSIVAPDS